MAKQTKAPTIPKAPARTQPPTKLKKRTVPKADGRYIVFYERP